MYWTEPEKSQRAYCHWLSSVCMKKKTCPYFFNLFSESRFWVWNALPRPTTKACKIAHPQNNRFIYHVYFRWQLPFSWCGNLHIRCSNWFCYVLLKVIFFALSGNIFQRVQETAKVQVSISGIDAQIISFAVFFHQSPIQNNWLHYYKRPPGQLCYTDKICNIAFSDKQHYQKENFEGFS